jgi:ABC-type transporter Mla maintaining outer membrane lipid asymmetry permease subunit MlaE
MSYETLDAIADAYTPLLLMLFLIGLGVNLYQCWPNYRKSVLDFVFLLMLLIASYGLMFIDKAFGLWTAFGSDYSTHTAVALSLVFALCVLTPCPAKWIAGSMCAYAGLMVYQQYHSVLDIISTAVVISIFALLFFRMIFSKKNRAAELVN